MVQILNLRTLNIFLAMPFIRAMSTSNFKQSIEKAMKGQSEIAIKAAKAFTVSKRKDLENLGALDIERPYRITGKLFGADEDENKNNTDPATSMSNVVTKIIHFQRHGQGFHNLICDIWREKGLPIDFDSHDPSLNPVIRTEFLDPPLTETGRQQCLDRREECAALTPDLVIVSPMLRCIQTAKLSFQDHCYPNRDDITWVSHDGCREELGLLMGNKRRKISEIKFDHPDIDFSAIKHDEDVLWEEYGDRRETQLEKSERIYDFLTDYVMQRPEKEIVIVCHSAYLFTLLNAVMDVEEEHLRYWFMTSEVRSIKVEFKENDKYVSE